MIHVIFVIQLIVSLLILRLVWWCKKKFNISINFNNLPLIIMVIIGVLGSILLSLTHILWYIPGIMLFSGIVWFLHYSVVLKDASLINRIAFSLLLGLFWSQTLAFMIFYALNVDKIKLNEDIKS